MTLLIIASLLLLPAALVAVFSLLVWAGLLDEACNPPDYYNYFKSEKEAKK